MNKTGFPQSAGKKKKDDDGFSSVFIFWLFMRHQSIKSSSMEVRVSCDWQRRLFFIGKRENHLALSRFCFSNSGFYHLDMKRDKMFL